MAELPIFLKLIDLASGPLKGFTDSFKRAGDEIGKAGRQMTVAGAAITASIGVVVKAGIDFQEQMAMVGTMLGDQSEKILPGYSSALLDLSKKFGESTDTLSRGLYDILSASIPTDQAIGVLEASVKAAGAGMTDAGVAADVLTTVINSYGLAAEDASDVSDLLFAVVKKGKTTFAEIAPVIGRVSSLGFSTGLSMEELGASLATMTQKGIRTEEAVTSIRGVLTAFLKPTKEAREAAAELGITLDSNTLKTHGLLEVVRILSTATNAQATAMFGNVRALSGLATILVDTVGFESNLAAMTNRAGETQLAFSIATDTLNFILKRLRTTINSLFITLSKSLMPTISRVAESVIFYIEQAEQWVKNNRELVTTIALTASKVGILLTVLGPTLIAVGALTKILAILFSKFFLISAAILALIVSIKAVVKSFDAWKEAIFSIWNVVREYATSVVKSFQAIAAAVRGRPKEALNILKKAVSGTFSAITESTAKFGEFYGEVWGNIATDAKKIWKIITLSGLDSLHTVFEKAKETSVELQSITPLFFQVWNAAAQAARENMQLWREDLNTFWEEFKSGWEESLISVADLGKTFFTGLTDTLGQTLFNMSKGVKSFSDIWKKFTDDLWLMFLKSVSQMVALWITGQQTMATATLAWKAIEVAQAAVVAVAHAIKSVFATVPWFVAFGIVGGVIAGVKAMFKGMQEGGIVTGPTFAQLGEAGSEAVIPLESPRARRMLQGEFGAEQNVININISGVFMEADEGKWSNLVREKIIPPIENWLDRRGEVLG